MSAEDRRTDLRGALTEVLSAQGTHSPEAATAVSWPKILIVAALKSEAAGDAAAQDDLIEAIAVLLGLGTEEYLTIPEAANRLAGERSRGFILSALHAEQEKAEGDAVRAFAYAIELVNLSSLPADNDQQLGDLITAAEAKALEGFMSGEAETEEVRLIWRRIHKLAEEAE